MKCILLIIFSLKSLIAFAGVKECRDLFVEQFKTVLEKDEGLITAKLQVTAIKVLQKVQNRTGVDSLETYSNSIIGNKTFERLASSNDIQNSVVELMNKFQGNRKYLNPSVQLERLKSLERLSDSDVSVLMASLQETWKGSDDFGFDESDIAFTAFVSEASRMSTGSDSFIISDFIKQFIDQKDLNKTLVDARQKVKAKVAKIKASVYSKYKEECLDFYGENNTNSQNISIFATCRMDEEKILDESLLLAIENIVGVEKLSLKLAPLSLMPKKRKDVREAQDDINKINGNENRIVEAYKRGVIQNGCNAFLTVDKKNSVTTLYDKDGSEIFQVNAIMGTGEMNEFKNFNPDSVLRKWPVLDRNGVPLIRNGKPVYKYTKTTGAGTYYVQKSLGMKERKQRLYDLEFNDRVLVLYSDKDDPKNEEVQAIHGVPNQNWIKNKDKRMRSFAGDNSDRKLSTGCVNLEGYSYDIINEFMQNKCPIYILPEDKDNYYFLKNGTLKFSSTSEERKKNEENSVMIYTDGTKREDPNNFNHYRFSPIDKTNRVVSIKGEAKDSLVLATLLQEKEELYKRSRLLENDDFEDLMSMTYAITLDPKESKAIFLNLYNSMYREKAPETLSQKAKRKEILKRYKKDFDPTTDINAIIEKASEVEFERN
jgi:hypothetical protein